MVRAAGSYPAGRWFESDRRYQSNTQRHTRPHGQAVKTSPFHGGNGSSILPGVTKREHSSAGRALALQARCHRFEPCCSHQEEPPIRVVFYWYGYITTGRRTVRKFTQSVNLTREDSINIMGISVYA